MTQYQYEDIQDSLSELLDERNINDKNCEPCRIHLPFLSPLKNQFVWAYKKAVSDCVSALKSYCYKYGVVEAEYIEMLHDLSEFINDDFILFKYRWSRLPNSESAMFKTVYKQAVLACKSKLSHYNPKKARKEI